MRLILIRHGASLHNGTSSPGLTDEGFQQVDLLARRLRALPDIADCRTLLSSPVLRAYQTAEVLAKRLELRPIVIDGDLTEIHAGEAEGLSSDAYEEQYGAFDLLAHPTRPYAPGGENWLQFIERVDTTLHRLAETYAGQTVLVATHAGFIVASFLVLFHVPRSGVEAWLDPLHSSVTEWQVDGAGVWTLRKYNDTTHLISVNAEVQ